MLIVLAFNLRIHSEYRGVHQKQLLARKFFGSRRQRRPIQICIAYYVQLLIYSCNYYFILHLHLHLHLRLQTHRPLPYLGVASDNYALRACLRNKRQTLRDEGLAIPLGGKCEPPA
jgi:hypothetical protein